MKQMLSWLGAAVLRVLLAVVGVFPLAWSRRLGAGLARTAIGLVPSRSRLVRESLALVEPDDRRRRVLEKSVLTNLGWTIGEMAHLSRIDANTMGRYLDWRNVENYERAKSRGRGVILVSGHFACWEWLAAHAIRFGPAGVIVRPIKNPYLDRYINERRRAAGLGTFSVRGSFSDMLRHLRGGGDLGFWIDQNCLRGEGVFVDFFGRPACTYKGLALLALRSRSPLVPIFAIREGGVRGKVTIEYAPPITPAVEGGVDCSVKELTQQCTAIIENKIREHPEQWFWVHNRWKTQPER